MHGLRIGLIGSGFIANQKHLPAWQKIERDAKVVALCDVNSSRAEEIARKYGVPRVYQDIDQMLEKEKVDIVDVCSPPQTHAALALRALQSGAHVLIEKPMAVSTEECDAIIAAASETRRHVCVAHSDLFYPAFAKARKLVSRGAIGEFKGMRILLSTPVDYITSNPDHWAHRLPGGVIGETGPHVVYLTLSFINPICDVRVHAQKLLPQFTWSPFEDYRLELIGEKAVSSVTLTYATPHWAAQVDIWGTEGLLKLDLETQSIVRYTRPSLKPAAIGFSALREATQVVQSTLGTASRILLGDFRNTHDQLVRGFVKSIRDRTAPPVTAQEGREAVRVMNLIVEKLRPQTV